MKLKLKIAILILSLGLLWVAGAYAQAAPPVPPAMFDMTGFIQEATVAQQGTTVTDPRLFGGTITLNGIKMIVPDNTIVQLPANAMTWAQLFRRNLSKSVNYNPPRPNHPNTNTGLALADSLTTHFPSFEVRVVGNVNGIDPGTGEPRYIVGLIVPIAQQGLNIGSGIINHIDYATGRFRVGGAIGVPTSGALVEINDPQGRFGRAKSPDPRFTCDSGNPTICTTTAYPVGIPRFDPAVQDDPDIPSTNRPLNGTGGFPVDPFIAIGAPLRTFQMPPPGTGATDQTKWVPLMVGDWVDYIGNLMKLDPTGANTPANMFISAHTVVANLGIYTSPGTLPAYINTAVLIGTAGNPVTAGNPPTVIPQEVSLRITVEGFCTDSTRLVNFYAINVDPVSGAESLHLLGSALPEAGPARPRGRYRFIVGKGAFTPVTREYVAIQQGGGPVPVENPVGLEPIQAGQYRLPCWDYIFTEGTIFGQPILPCNFQDIPFLAQGCGPLGGEGSGGPIIGRLDPWPGP